MTEKRFTLTFDDKIVDNLTGIIHDVHSGYDVAMDLSGLLNALHDENEQLKQQSNSVYEIVKEYVMSHHCISTMRMLKKIEKVM